MKINVIEVKERPTLKNPAMQQGIRDKAEAESWASKHGYSTVYFWKRNQRVYAEKLTARVDAKAKQIEKKSAKLVEQLEMSL